MAPQLPVDARGEMARRGARVGDEGFSRRGLERGRACGPQGRRTGRWRRVAARSDRRATAAAPDSPCVSTCATVPRRPCTFAAMASAPPASRHGCPVRCPRGRVYEPARAWNVGDDLEILDRDKGGDLLVARDNEGERRRLDPPQGVDAVGAGAAGAERLCPSSHSGRRASRLAADSGRHREGRDRCRPAAMPETGEDRLPRERRDPQAFDRLAAARQRVDEIEDQLPSRPASAALTIVVTSARPSSRVMTVNWSRVGSSGW